MIQIETVSEMLGRQTIDLLENDSQNLTFEMRVKAKEYLTKTKDNEGFESLVKKIKIIENLTKSLLNEQSKSLYYRNLSENLLSQNVELREQLIKEQGINEL